MFVTGEDESSQIFIYPAIQLQKVTKILNFVTASGLRVGPFLSIVSPLPISRVSLVSLHYFHSSRVSTHTSPE
jgi:hypothetical protein